jgi:dephospho-CoA kinase
MLIVGLTGGIASGKTTVSGIFKAAGVHVLEADQIARQVVMPGRPAWHEIVAYFGPSVLKADKSIDRKGLGAIVFNDAEKRKKLESFVHPWVRHDLDAETARIALSQPEALVVQDIPLLLETGMHQRLAEIIVVYVPEEIQIERLMKRDGIERAEALIRVRSQMPIEKKKQQATIVIDNSGSLAQTRKQALHVLQRLEAAAIAAGS